MGKIFLLHRSVISSALAAAAPTPLVREITQRVVTQLGFKEAEQGTKSRSNPIEHIMTQRGFTQEEEGATSASWSLGKMGLVVGLGKAAGAMMEGAREALSKVSCDWLCITKDHHPAPLWAERYFTSHPLPDERSVAAGELLLQRASALGPDGWLLLLLSGGASSLACAPRPPLTLTEKRSITQQLLLAGVEISLCNTVRKALSRVKGGGLLQAAYPAKALALVLSDVIGGSLEDVGSGPLASPVDRALAKDILIKNHLWEGLSRKIQEALEEEGEQSTLPAAPHYLVGDRHLLLQGATEALAREGFSVRVLDDGFVGSVEALVERLGVALATLSEKEAVLVAGEPTLTVRGPGRGGRAQHTALMMAKRLQQREGFSFSAVGSDGTDGPTEHAGAIVDEESWDNCRKAGVDPEEALQQYNSEAAHKAAGSLLTTGPTGTNVNDLFLLLRS